MHWSTARPVSYSTLCLRTLLSASRKSDLRTCASLSLICGPTSRTTTITSCTSSDTNFVEGGVVYRGRGVGILQLCCGVPPSLQQVLMKIRFTYISTAVALWMCAAQSFVHLGSDRHGGVLCVLWRCGT